MVKRQIPAIPGNIPTNIRKPLEALRQAVMETDVQAVVRDTLLKTGVVEKTPGGSLRPKPGGGGGGGVAPQPMPAITGLTATGGLAMVFLEWDPVTTPSFDHVEIWRSTVDDIGTAVMVGTARASIYADTPPNTSTSVTYFYWVRAVNSAGEPGPFNAVAGTPGTTGSDPSYLLSVLAGQISESQLAQSLAGRINLIDTPGTGLIDVTSQHTSQISSLNTNVSTLANDVNALSNDMNMVIARSQATLSIYECRFSADWNPADWTAYVGTSLATASVVAPSGEPSLEGGQVLRIGDNVGNDMLWIINRNAAIPFDPNMLYKITVRVRQLQGAGTIYVGWAGLDATKRLVNITGNQSAGSQHYHCMTGVTPGATFAEYSGYTQGYGSVNGTAVQGTFAMPGKMHPNVKWIAPLIIANYSGKPGVVEFDYLRVEDATAANVQANANAITGLDTTVTNLQGQVTANSTAITQLQTDLSTANGNITANTNAISALDTRVTTNTNNITANSSSITQLQTDLATANNNITANAGAIQALDTRVTTNANNITANSSAITTLQADLTTANSNISANTNAIQALDTRVTAAEGNITANATAITNLQASVADLSGFNVIASANVSYANGIIKKTGGTTGWNEQAYSDVGYKAPVIMAFRPGRASANGYRMAGLNRDPAASVNYQNIDYAIYCALNGQLKIYESGIFIGNFGTYSADDVLSVEYDGTNVIYKQNGNVLRTVAANITVPLYFDSSFYTIGSAIEGLVFGPTKAAANAVNSQQASASSDGALSADISALKATVNDPATGVAANAAAIGTLQTDVTNLNGNVAANASAITQLQTDVNGNTAAIQTVQKVQASQNRNLVTPTIASLPLSAPGTVPVPAGWALNGTAAENAIVTRPGPSGVDETVWECVPDAGSNADGGFHTNIETIDPTKTYRFMCFFAKSVLTFGGGGDGNAYFGLYGYGAGANIGVIRKDTGAVVTNPYFHGGSMGLNTVAAAGDWVLAVGYVHPAGTVADGIHQGAIYDVKTGKKIMSIIDYIWQANNDQTRLRAYLYYCTNTAVRQWMTRPFIEVVDGTEKPISAILADGHMANLSAQYMIKTDVNGKIAGFGLYNDGATSAFIVNANKFAVSTGDPTVPDSYPFLIQTDPVTGKPTIYMDTALIKAATITDAHIASLAADKVTGGTISAAVSLTSPQIMAGQATGLNTGVGVYLDSSGVFRAGDPAGNYIMWDGAQLSINAPVNYTNVVGGPPADADRTKTVIDGGLITTGYIRLSTGGHIRSGQSAFATGTGFWLGNDAGVAKFSIGNANKYLRWNGSILEYTGTLSRHVRAGSNMFLRSSRRVDNSSTSYTTVKKCRVEVHGTITVHWQRLTSNLGFYYERILVNGASKWTSGKLNPFASWVNVNANITVNSGDVIELQTRSVSGGAYTISTMSFELRCNQFIGDVML